MLLSEALPKAWKDPELRDIHFVTPFLAAVARAGSTPALAPYNPTPPPKIGDSWGFHPYQQKGAKDKGKGKGKWGLKGKGKGDWWPKGKGDWSSEVKMGQLTDKTPKGLRICFRYNSEKDPAKQCAGNCGMEHVCRIQGCFRKECQAFKCSMASKEARAKLQQSNH